ncbi:hypothetical protein K435DRAFT_885568 [Dendrothele bispora CBS 962.96]|uniref:Uncharacterized protein n=1 Tax=Dendrothele bispora (strain CBS 962.96) TaxID=1314807 RepID=A0A4S8M8E2_DENBC|nr:hypothetical protein K435DRAFT_885568 [Dendrothele bispora CBS 962.96]
MARSYPCDTVSTDPGSFESEAIPYRLLRTNRLRLDSRMMAILEHNWCIPRGSLDLEAAHNHILANPNLMNVSTSGFEEMAAHYPWGGTIRDTLRNLMLAWQKAPEIFCYESENEDEAASSPGHSALASAPRTPPRQVKTVPARQSIESWINLTNVPDYGEEPVLNSPEVKRSGYRAEPHRSIHSLDSEAGGQTRF